MKSFTLVLVPAIIVLSLAPAVAQQPSEIVRISKTLYCAKISGQWSLGIKDKKRFVSLAAQIRSLQRAIKRHRKNGDRAVLKNLRRQIKKYQSDLKRKAEECQPWSLDFRNSVAIVRDRGGLSKVLADGTFVRVVGSKSVGLGDPLARGDKYYLNSFSAQHHAELGTSIYYEQSKKRQRNGCYLLIADQTDGSIKCAIDASDTKVLVDFKVTAGGTIFFINRDWKDRDTLRRYSQGVTETISSDIYVSFGICDNESVIFKPQSGQPFVRYNPALNPPLKRFDNMVPQGFPSAYKNLILADGNSYFLDSQAMGRYLCAEDKFDQTLWLSSCIEGNVCTGSRGYIKFPDINGFYGGLGSVFGKNLVELNGRYFDVAGDLIKGNSYDGFPVQIYPEAQSFVSELATLFPFFSAQQLVAAPDLDKLVILVGLKEFRLEPGPPTPNGNEDALVLFDPTTGLASLLKRYPARNYWTVHGMVYLGGGRLLVAVSSDDSSTIEEIDIRTGKLLRTRPGSFSNRPNNLLY